METAVVFKIGFVAVLAFAIAIALTPMITHFLFKYKLGKQIRDVKSAPIFSKLHENKAGTPTMGGIIIWLTVALLALGISALAKFTDYDFFNKFNFLTREQTLLPL